MTRLQEEDLLPMKERHRILKKVSYERPQVRQGYANRTLVVDLTQREIQMKEVSRDLKDTFIGGRGFGLWYLWESVTGETAWNDPENSIIISCGPIGGVTQYPGAGKSYVVTISPLTGIPIDSNVGGYFGPYLKFSGFDALSLTGKADEETILFIDGDNHTITLETAPEESMDSHILVDELTRMYADSWKGQQHISVVSAGSGAQHVKIGLLNFSYFDLHKEHIQLKQAGRGGIGSVFRDKKVKALVVKYSNLSGGSNKPFDLEILSKTGIRMHREIMEQDALQNNMRKKGTTYLTGIMNDYDLLPVYNFKFGHHPLAERLKDTAWEKYLTPLKGHGCWYGCTLGCVNYVEGLQLKTGPYSGERVVVDGPEYETIAGVGSNCGIFDPAIILEVNFYCDTYGIDTISFGTLCGFLMDLYSQGVIDSTITGGLDLSFGNWEAQLELLHQMAEGEGFGIIAGQGIGRMKEIFVKDYSADPALLADIGMECKGLEFSEYISKESLAQQGGYGIANKGPQHDEAWLIFMDMVNNQLPTFEDKAEALHYFPMFRTWFSLVGLCKLPWNDVVPVSNAEEEEPNRVPEHVKNYVDLFHAVTGKEVTSQDLILQSERVYTFQRVFNLRMGKGRRRDDAIPYRAMGPVTVEEYESNKERYDLELKEEVGFDPHKKSTEEKIKALREYREKRYELLLDAVYKRRGWTKEGIPTLETLKRLGVDYPEVVEVVRPFLE